MNPVAFQFGAITITWYGIMMAGAFLAGLWTASRRAAQGGIRPEAVLDLGPWLVLGVLVGARALYVLTFWHEQFADKPVLEWFKVWQGGLVFYGGLIGSCLACLLYFLAKRLPVWKFADVLAPSIPLGYALGRIGCLMNGCCYGREAHLPWAIHFPAGHDSYPKPVHPTQLYDFSLGLGLYATLAWLYRRRKFDGQIFAGYLTGYALLRFFVEMFRGDYPASQHYLGGWATPAQVVSLGILLCGIILWRLLPKPAVEPGPGQVNEPEARPKTEKEPTHSR